MGIMIGMAIGAAKRANLATGLAGLGKKKLRSDATSKYGSRQTGRHWGQKVPSGSDFNAPGAPARPRRYHLAPGSPIAHAAVPPEPGLEMAGA